MTRVALTGTPGCGKSTLAQVAQGHGWRVVDVKRWAAEKGCIVGRDEQDDAVVVDTKRLARHVPEDDGSKVLYEGHLSHLLPLDVAWVLRCDPQVLRHRLEARGYKPSKVLENLEAEALDIVLQEALEHQPRVIQRDGTRRTPAQLYKAFADIPFDSLKAHDLEPADWSDQMPFRIPR
jgi:adenylate kinase